MRLFETKENEAIDSHKLRINESEMPHCKIYNHELETVRARKRACMYGIPIAIGL